MRHHKVEKQLADIVVADEVSWHTVSGTEKEKESK